LFLNVAGASPATFAGACWCQREAMGPFVLEERSSFYTGRELGIPGRVADS
jgi:hypothetical protein